MFSLIAKFFRRSVTVTAEVEAEAEVTYPQSLDDLSVGQRVHILSLAGNWYPAEILELDDLEGFMGNHEIIWVKVWFAGDWLETRVQLDQVALVTWVYESEEEAA